MKTSKFECEYYCRKILKEFLEGLIGLFDKKKRVEGASHIYSGSDFLGQHNSKKFKKSLASYGMYRVVYEPTHIAFCILRLWKMNCNIDEIGQLHIGRFKKCVSTRWESKCKPNMAFFFREQQIKSFRQRVTSNRV